MKINHISIIMDGNRRWAIKNGLNIQAGYEQGIITLKKIIKTILENEIKYLTVYAFSYENWNRPLKEIAILINTGMNFILENEDFFMENNIKCVIIGNKDLIPQALANIINETEEKTKNNTGLNFQIALSYGSRNEILRASVKYSRFLANDGIISEQEFSKFLDTHNIPDPDILIRTGGENRLSNYLLWQIAYTEIFFQETLWPDFSSEELYKILEKFYKINRRYGAI